MRLKGKTALITGATSGIGLATAELFVREGAQVAITGRDEARLKRARAKLGGAITTIQADVRNSEDMTRMARQVADAFGDDGLDVFFGNAGVAFSTPLLTTDEARFDELLAVNVKGLFFSMQAVTPVLRDGASVILNSAWLNNVGMGGFSALAATKAAVRSFARSWSCELLDRKIRVNAVSPGAVDTPIFELEGATPAQLAETKRQMSLRIPAGRMGEPLEIAQAVLFLASDDSRYMMGAEIVVDGGFAQL
ncbi:short-chain dehydrogenase [Burkholderia ambifaria]|jgi:NAD(P)-dependent dehydrogenase (short-subunit alcohol dehydrogenase family)|uniref:SDR family oxidoreductase n=1 Tax=Burkholderia ambifaria TaxID=152480 RepID=UPI000D002993|nr:SDR family oxidoreductase [Burkholderia ambifaria]PRF97285.1 short-chain dehydrogenase [Burkholderia ambifaria]